MFAVGLQFVLFAILGWCLFSPSANRTIPMIVFIVLMILWLVGALGVSAGWFGAH